MQLENIEPDGVKRSKVTLAVSQEDAEKLLQAFKEGSLKPFGITEMTIGPALAGDTAGSGRWTERSTHSKKPEHAAKKHP